MFEFDAVLHEVNDKGGAYVIFPWNIREVFGKGRVRVLVEFDSLPYKGSIVNMGVKDSEGKVCYIIGVLKSIRRQLGKKDGDTIHVVVKNSETKSVLLLYKVKRTEKPPCVVELG